MKPMRFGYFGILSVYLTGLAAASAISGPPGSSLLVDVGMVLAQLVALWGYELRSKLALLGGFIIGVLLLPSVLAFLPLNVLLNSLLIVPAAIVQLELGLRRLGGAKSTSNHSAALPDGPSSILISG